MKETLLHYSINEQTMALIPKKSPDYNTLVLAKNQNYFVRKPPLEMIKQSCLQHFNSYTGIREAVVHNTGYKNKVPIPINAQRNIYTFPTLSPNDENCVWLFYHQICKITKSKAEDKSFNQSIIYFKNGAELPIKVSPYVLKKQMFRTGMCVNQYWEMMRIIGD